jgi:hypothetical protein
MNQIDRSNEVVATPTADIGRGLWLAVLMLAVAVIALHYGYLFTYILGAGTIASAFLLWKAPAWTTCIALVWVILGVPFTAVAYLAESGMDITSNETNRIITSTRQVTGGCTEGELTVLSIESGYIVMTGSGYGSARGDVRLPFTDIPRNIGSTPDSICGAMQRDKMQLKAIADSIREAKMDSVWLYQEKVAAAWVLINTIKYVDSYDAIKGRLLQLRIYKNRITQTIKYESETGELYSDSELNQWHNRDKVYFHNLVGTKCIVCGVATPRLTSTGGEADRPYTCPDNQYTDSWTWSRESDCGRVDPYAGILGQIQ